MICSPVSTCARSAIHIKSRARTHICGVIARESSNFRCYSFNAVHHKAKFADLGLSVSDRASGPLRVGFQLSGGSCFSSCFSTPKGNFWSLSVNQSISAHKSLKGQLEISVSRPNAKMNFLVPKQGVVPDIKCKTRNLSWSSRFAFAGLIVSLLVCFSNSDPVYADAPKDKEVNKNEHNQSGGKFHSGKRVYTNYSITGIPGDGRCLFRSVAHGASLRAGKPPPSESLQRELADELRARVADEFIKRREETEWFVEGDFDSYISQIRKPHVWGGEPELFMASHVLQMPITVYMHDEKAGGLICIAEYGQEYGKDNPIQVIYHGFGHYDALQIHERKGPKSKL